MPTNLRTANSTAKSDEEKAREAYEKAKKEAAANQHNAKAAARLIAARKAYIKAQSGGM